MKPQKVGFIAILMALYTILPTEAFAMKVVDSPLRDDVTLAYEQSERIETTVNKEEISNSETLETLVRKDESGIMFKYVDGAMYKFVGLFTISHYCKCPKCCGKYSSIPGTATGAPTIEGVTAAVDPKVIPLHSKMYIEGYGTREAEDVGGAIKKLKIDVFVSTHEKAMDLGLKKEVPVWVLVTNR